MGYLYGVVIGFDWNPSGAKWILKNPSDEVVYTVDTDIDYEQIGGLPDLPDWAVFFPITWQWYFSPKTYVFRAGVPDIRVPAFPTQGTWKAELYLYDMKFGIFEDSIMMVSYRVSITESSMLDNIMAPIYISWGGMEWTGFGSFSIALPGIFWLSMPIWGFFIFVFIIRLWRGSFKLAMRDFRKGIEEINKRRTRKGVKK